VERRYFCRLADQSEFWNIVTSNIDFSQCQWKSVELCSQLRNGSRWRRIRPWAAKDEAEFEKANSGCPGKKCATRYEKAYSTFPCSASGCHEKAGARISRSQEYEVDLKFV
jgi:hypothetical protein